MPALRTTAILAPMVQALFVLQFGVAAAPVPSGDTPALRIHPDFPHCFQSPAGQPLLLLGDYTWGTFSDVDFDYQAQFDALKANGLNFARVWLWWGCEQFPPPDAKLHFNPFARPGPGQANDGRSKYDLTQFNPAFFARLRGLCAAARARGLFLQLITMDAWMLKHAHLWKLHAFHRDNNLNGVDGDPGNTGTGIDGERGFCSLGNPKALAFQQAYLRKLVATVSDFDNLVLEIANENYYSAAWERRLCEFLRERERPQPLRHVLMPLDLLSHSRVVQRWEPNLIHAALLEQRRLRQPLIFDTDWILNPNDDEVRRAMWTAVLSGAHFNYMDDSLEFRGTPAPDKRAALHRQIGRLARFLQRLKPWAMMPDDTLVKAGRAFALASTNELAAYLPHGGAVTLDLSGLKSQLTAQWFDPREGTLGKEFSMAGGHRHEFQPPGDDDWTLWLQRESSR